MNSMPRSASLLLAAVIFILVSFNITGIVFAQESSYADPLAQIKLFHSAFKDSINCPIHENDEFGIFRDKMRSSKSLSSNLIDSYIAWQKMQSKDEKIIMNGSNSHERINDLRALNCAKNQDIFYSEVQENKNEIFNSADIQVKNNPSNNANIFQDDYALETFIDESVNTGLKNVAEQNNLGSATEFHPLGNYLNIEVSGITVSAINTVPGGNAVADSDIIIKPVQIIAGSSEVEEKIK